MPGAAADRPSPVRTRPSSKPRSAPPAAASRRRPGSRRRAALETERTGRRPERTPARESALDRGRGPAGDRPAGEAIVVWSYFDGDRSGDRRPRRARPVAPAPLRRRSRPATVDALANPRSRSTPAGNAIAGLGPEAAGDAGRVVVATGRPAAPSARPRSVSEAGAAVASSPRIAVDPPAAATVVWHRIAGPKSDAIQAVEPARRRRLLRARRRLRTGATSPLYPGARDQRRRRHRGRLERAAAAAPTECSRPRSARPAAASRPPREIAPTTHRTLSTPDVAIDGFGDATVVWTRDQRRQHDRPGRRLRRLRPPELRGALDPRRRAWSAIPVSFSASPFDVWPIAPASFAFGDGARRPATRSPTSTPAPGTYPVTVTVADGAGTPATPARARSRSGRAATFTVGKLKLNKKKGTGDAGRRRVDGPGQLDALRQGAEARREVTRPGAGTVKVPIDAEGKALKKLKQEGEG